MFVIKVKLFAFHVCYFTIMIIFFLFCIIALSSEKVYNMLEYQEQQQYYKLHIRLSLLSACVQRFVVPSLHLSLRNECVRPPPRTSWIPQTVVCIRFVQFVLAAPSECDRMCGTRPASRVKAPFPSLSSLDNGLFSTCGPSPPPHPTPPCTAWPRPWPTALGAECKLSLSCATLRLDGRTADKERPSPPHPAPTPIRLRTVT